MQSEAESCWMVCSALSSPLYWEEAQLFTTGQWLKASVLAIPLVLWQGALLSHESQTLISCHYDGICHFSVALAEPSLIVRQGDRLSLVKFVPPLKHCFNSPPLPDKAHSSLALCMASLRARCCQQF